MSGREDELWREMHQDPLEPGSMANEILMLNGEIGAVRARLAAVTEALRLVEAQLEEAEEWIADPNYRRGERS